MDIVLLALRLTLAGLLYVFLGAVFLFLWRDLRKAPVERRRNRPKGRLVILDGADEEADAWPAGRSFPLEPVTSVGRSPRNTVVVPDTFASSEHALLSWREDHWWLEDCNSRNGTRVNGETVDSPTIVSEGDVITIGRTNLRLEMTRGEGVVAASSS